MFRYPKPLVELQKGLEHKGLSSTCFFVWCQRCNISASYSCCISALRLGRLKRSWSSLRRRWSLLPRCITELLNNLFIIAHTCPYHPWGRIMDRHGTCLFRRNMTQMGQVYQYMDDIWDSNGKSIIACNIWHISFCKKRTFPLPCLFTRGSCQLYFISLEELCSSMLQSFFWVSGCSPASSWFWW